MWEQLKEQDKRSKMTDMKIIKYATVIYSDGREEDFNVLRITDKKVIGLLNGKFLECRFISKRKIKDIKYGSYRRYLDSIKEKDT